MLNVHKPDGLWNPEDTPTESVDGDTTSGISQSIAPANDKVQTGPIPFVSSAESSILPIVTSQRDRFRQRNAELEEVSCQDSGLPIIPSEMFG